MNKFNYLLLMLVFSAFLSCQPEVKQNQKPTSVPTEHSDTILQENFESFIQEFSSDSNFQKSRIQFPLKITLIDENNKSTEFFKKSNEFEMMDFRMKKSKGKTNQWEQNIVINEDHKSAQIQIRGIDNGIHVDYLFKKINGNWFLFEITDQST